MLIKNLKIILDPSVSDHDVNDPNQLIFFGPLVMKQQLFVDKSNNEKFLKVVTDKRTIQSDQLSYLARSTAPQTININTVKPFDSDINDSVKPEISTIRLDRMKMGAALNTGLVFNALKTNPLLFTRPKRPFVTASISPMDEVSAVRPILVADHKLKSGIFIPINLPQPAATAAVTFRITDNKNNAPVYKCSISIIGTNSNNETNRVFNIETDHSGAITQNIPVGEYKLSLKADEYSVLDTRFSIADTNPQILEYKLQRQEIKFKSFFLIGMICEKMPKIPST